jgi:late competence protein required for DNA uptake (superfamily II DNA/RNA helicase)
MNEKEVLAFAKEVESRTQEKFKNSKICCVYGGSYQSNSMAIFISDVTGNTPIKALQRYINKFKKHGIATIAENY